MGSEVRFLPAGDSALVAEFGREVDEAVNQRVHDMAHWLEMRRIPGVTEVLPTFRSLMVFYDPAVLSYDVLVRKLRQYRLATATGMAAEKTVLQVPCCYDGPDLDGMTALIGLSREEIIAIHSGVDYKIYMMGFLPGFVYLGGLDKRICVPRLETPRTRIEPGSVGIGGSQTGVYPVASPGGWRILGRTYLKFYDPNRAEPILCRAGQYIRFVPISREAYEEGARKEGLL